MGYFQSSEVRGTDSNGDEFWVNVSAQPTIYEGKPALLNALIDITQSRRSSGALERLRRQNELILNSGGETIYGLDLKGNLTFVNRATVAITGQEAQGLIGKPQHDPPLLETRHTAPNPKDESPLQNAIEGGVQYHAENEVFCRKDGSGFRWSTYSTLQSETNVVG